MASEVEQELALWNEDGFGGVAFGEIDPPEDPNLPMIAPDLDPLVNSKVLPPDPEVVPDPVAEIPLAPIEPDEPISITLEDGSTIQIEKNNKGWKGSVDIGTGSTQVYYGKTKNELLQNVLVAQVHATKKIRDQNRTIKLGVVETTEPTPTRVEPKIAELTADDIFSIKTKLESNPDLAFTEWFQKKTGLSPAQLVTMARDGQSARKELQMEQANKEFLAANPTYYPDNGYQNFNALITYLCKHKLRRGRKPNDEQGILDDLIDGGHYTAQNLEIAFTELSEDGLLLKAPREPKPTPIAEPVTPAAPASERIVRTETRPRAGLGIRSSEVTPTPTTVSTPPPVEDYSKLSDAQIDELIAAERRKVLGSRR